MTRPQTFTPGAAQLMDWLENRLPAEEAAALAQSVQRDPALQQQAAWLRIAVTQKRFIPRVPDRDYARRTADDVAPPAFPIAPAG